MRADTATVRQSLLERAAMLEIYAGYSPKRAWRVANDEQRKRIADRKVKRNHKVLARGLKRGSVRGSKSRKKLLDRFFVAVVSWFSSHTNERFSKRLAIDLMVSCMPRRINTPAGALAQRSRAEMQLRMPTTQAYLAEKLANAGLSTETQCQVLADIVKDAKVEPEVRLKGLDMAFRLTTGYAPTKQATLHVNADNFFDPKVFGDGSPPTIDAEAP